MYLTFSSDNAGRHMNELNEITQVTDTWPLRAGMLIMSFDNCSSGSFRHFFRYIYVLKIWSALNAFLLFLRK